MPGTTDPVAPSTLCSENRRVIVGKKRTDANRSASSLPTFVDEYPTE